MSLSIPTLSGITLAPGPVIPSSAASALASISSALVAGFTTPGPGRTGASSRPSGVAGSTGRTTFRGTGTGAGTRSTHGANSTVARSSGGVATVSSGVTSVVSASGAAAGTSGSAAGSAGGAAAPTSSRAGADRALGSVGWAAGAVMGVAGVVFAM